MKEGKENPAGNGRGRAARGPGITLRCEARRGEAGRPGSFLCRGGSEYCTDHLA